MLAIWPRQRRDRGLAAAGLAIAISCAWSTAALACSARAGPIVVDAIGYDPFVDATTEGWLRFDVDLADGDDCDVEVELTDEGGALAQQFRLGPTGEVVFVPELRPAANVRPLINTAQAGVHLTKDAPHARLEWHLRAPADTVLPPGDFTAPVLATVRAAGGDTTAPVRGSIVIHSVARAQANLAGVAGHFSAGSDAATIDLGELTSGKRGTAYLQVRSNISAQLAFRSASGGYLVNASTPQSRVRYTMELAGVPVDLRGPASVAIGPQMSINGTAIEIAVTVGEVTGAAAGRYLDTVTIDIS